MGDATYKLIGVVRGNATTMTKATDASPDGRAKAEVQIEDVTGMKATWGTFHVSMAKDLELGKWYEFEVATPAKAQGQGVWHNLEGVVRGPIEKPAPGTTGHQEAEAATGPAHTVKSDQQFKIERTSLQRQGALGIVTRLIEHGVGMNELAGVVDRLLEEAVKVEAFYERDIEQPAAPKSKGSPAKAEQSKLSVQEPEVQTAPTNGAEPQVPEFTHVGNLLTWFTRTFTGKTSRDLCELVGVKAPTDIEDFAAAAEAAKAKWGVAA